MSQIVGEGVLHVSVDDRDVGAGVDKAGQESGKRFTSGFKNSIKGLAGAVGGALAVTGAVGFIKDAVGGASDLNETVSKTKVVFGDAAGQIFDFASKGATAFGQTKQQVLDAAGTFGTFGKAAGLEGKGLGDFSTKLTGLSSDLASFFNTDPSEAAAAIAGGLRGESEGLRQYGILLDDSTLKAEALRLGLLKPVKDKDKILAAQVRVTEAQKAYNDAVSKSGKGSEDALKAQAALGTAHSTLQKATEGTIGPLTQQQRVLAAQSQIMKQSKDAQGDFARTSGGLANQQRILSASFVDFRTKAGAALLPVVLKVVSGINSLAQGFIHGTGTGGKLKAALTPLAQTVKDFIGDFKNGVGVAGAFRSVLEHVGKAALDVVKFLGQHREIIVLLIAAYAAWKVAVVVNNTVSAIQLGLLKAQTLGTTEYAIVSKIAAAASAVMTGAQWLLNAAMEANPIGLIVLALVALTAGFVLAYKKSATFRAIVQGALSGVQKAASAIIGFFKDHWPLLLAILTGPIGLAVLFIVKHWDKIRSGTVDAFKAVKSAAEHGVQAVVDAVLFLPKKLLGLGDNMLHVGETLIKDFLRGLSRLERAEGVPEQGHRPDQLRPRNPDQRRVRQARLHQPAGYPAPGPRHGELRRRPRARR
jgi:hypothetical protein